MRHPFFCLSTFRSIDVPLHHVGVPPVNVVVIAGCVGWISVIPISTPISTTIGITVIASAVIFWQGLLTILIYSRTADLEATPLFAQYIEHFSNRGFISAGLCHIARRVRLVVDNVISNSIVQCVIVIIRAHYLTVCVGL